MTPTDSVIETTQNEFTVSQVSRLYSRIRRNKTINNKTPVNRMHGNSSQQGQSTQPSPANLQITEQQKHPDGISHNSGPVERNTTARITACR